MNNEKDEFVNTEVPLEASKELLKELMEASAQIDRREVYSNEEVMAYLNSMGKWIIAHKHQEALLK